MQRCLVQRLISHPADAFSSATDIYPESVTSVLDAVHSRRQESPEIKALRIKAQLIADSVRGLIAVQTFAWGSGQKEAAAYAPYEILVTDGFYQQFREYPDRKKWSMEAPESRLSTYMSTASKWFELPEFIGTEPQIRIQQNA